MFSFFFFVETIRILKRAITLPVVERKKAVCKKIQYIMSVSNFLNKPHFTCVSKSNEAMIPVGEVPFK